MSIDLENQISDLRKDVDGLIALNVKQREIINSHQVTIEALVGHTARIGKIVKGLFDRIIGENDDYQETG